MSEPDATDIVKTVDLRSLFGSATSATQWIQALQGVAARVKGELQELATTADDAASGVTERTEALLEELVDQLPIRRAEDLWQEYGPDAHTVASHVVDSAATLAKWLWTATDRAPVPSQFPRPAKVLLHSFIEIRMIGELYESRRDPAVNSEPTPPATVLAAYGPKVQPPRVPGRYPHPPPWSATCRALSTR